MFEIIILISEHLHLAELKRRLLAFDGLCRARVRVTERLLAYYRRFRMSTRLLLSLRSSNEGCQTCTSLQHSLCGAQMGVAKHVLAFDSLCGA